MGAIHYHDVTGEDADVFKVGVPHAEEERRVGARQHKVSEVDFVTIEMIDAERERHEG
ncbi:MAG: hypothetical protein ABI837_15065 [Acidobacteriota bacterium]